MPKRIVEATGASASGTSRSAVMDVGEGHVSFHRPREMPGIEILRAHSCSRLWTWFHTQYAICTPLRFEGRVEYLYRGHVREGGPRLQALLEPGAVHVTKLLTAPAT